MQSQKLDSSNAQQTILAWREDPALFVRQAIHAEPQAWQADFLRAVAQNDRVAVRACHGPGKSTALAWLILWWLYTRYPAKVACTAPTAHQLEDILWAELSMWWRRLYPAVLREQTNIKTDKIELAEAPKESFAVARTARPDNPDAFQGFHSENMLFLVDEASGVADIIFEVGSGAMSTKGAKTVLAGNPTRTSGYFYEAFHKAREFWHCIRVSHEDSELVTDEYVEQMAAIYGRDSNVFRVRCLGEFPRSEDDVVIPLWMCEAALECEVEPLDTLMPVWGLDVARYGSDRSALCKRQANRVLEPVQWWHGNDLMETVGRVMDEYLYAVDHGEAPAEILVDVIGVGAGVLDRLNELGLPARGVNVGSQARRQNFTRLRSELWWMAREWLQGMDVILPKDDALIAELTQVKYKTLSTGKLEVEPKDDMIKRIGRSPDLADAFILTFGGGLDKAHLEKEKQMDRYQKRMRTRNARSWKTI